MLDSKGVSDYWEEQTRKGDNPCHYHNKWQDRYAFEVRTRAFRHNDFEDAMRVVDIGCGVGEYTVEIAKLTNARIDAFDFPFNIGIAKQTYGSHPRIFFHDTPVPSKEIAEAIANADVVFTTTVYVHFSPEARAAFYEYISKMRKGGRVLLLEYVPNKIPEFQMDLPYKEVETSDVIEAKFQSTGFHLKEKRHVNYVDSYLFFKIGKNAFSFWFTRMIERVLYSIGYTNSKYKLLVFERV